jgi:ABC-type Fe3+ transport system substrate-binding protein
MGAVTSIQLATTPPPRAFGEAHAPRATARGWDFLGSCPSPLRMRMRDELADILRDIHRQRGERLKGCMPMGQGGRTPFERLRAIRDIQDFPKLLVSSDHGNAFNRAFHARHVETGAFAALQFSGAAAPFVEAGLIDPRGWIGVYAVAPFVMLVDRARLGERKIPQSWADLADPVYRGEIALSGWRPEGPGKWRAFNLFFLVAIARLLGDKVLHEILRNLAGLTHSAQMPRIAGTQNSLAAIYVLPWALADMCPRRDRAEVVWPREGALAFPLWMTARAAHQDRVAPLADYFFAENTARWLDHNRYPSLAPTGGASLPDGARFAWPGWDFFRARSTASEIKRIGALFHAATEKLDRSQNLCA